MTAIQDENISCVTYPKNKYKKNKYDAIGICKIKLSKNDPRNRYLRIFTISIIRM